MIWSERYDRDIENIFDVKDEITQSMVTGLAPEIGAHERRISRRKPTESLSAWEMCQHGRRSRPDQCAAPLYVCLAVILQKSGRIPGGTAIPPGISVWVVLPLASWSRGAA